MIVIVIPSEPVAAGELRPDGGGCEYRMGTGKRRRDGGPEYPLERVHKLARLLSIHLTLKARDEAAALLPPSVGLPAHAVRKTLLALCEEHWKFAEENERG